MTPRRLVALSIVAGPADPPTEGFAVPPVSSAFRENYIDRVLRSLGVAVSWALVVAIVAVLALSVAAFVLFGGLAVAFVLAPYVPVPITLLGLVGVVALAVIAGSGS